MSKKKKGSDIFSDIREFSRNKQWDEFDKMFSDELLNGDDDASKCVLIVHSRYYDNWLTKRQNFIDGVVAQLEDEDDKDKESTIK